jgi:thiol-disulfide isomerase/thioredoxin
MIIIGSLQLQAQEVEVWNTDQLIEYIEKPSEKLKVINFWATWCAPCIKEMPFFEAAAEDFKDIDLLLVSLDFADQVDSKVIPFIKKKDIKSKVVIQGDEKYNEWIDRIDPAWSGAIPVTLIVRPDGTKSFFEKEFKNGELHTLIVNELNQKP